MYMLTNYGGSGLQVVVPDPPDAGGAAINANFKALATQVAAADPGADDDATAGFGVGSRWYNYATTLEWICLDATPGGADWVAIAGSALADYLPLAGGTLTGTLNMDGGAIADVGSISGTYFTGDVSLYTSATYTWHQLTAGILTAFNGDGHLVTAILPYQIQISNFYATDYPTYINVGSPSILSGGLSIVGGDLNINGNTANMNAGGGTRGNTLNIDGGNIYGSAFASGEPGGDWHLGDGTGSHGGTLNMDGGTLNMSNGAGTGGQTLNMDGALLQNIGYSTTPPTLAGDSQFAFSYDESTDMLTITVKRSDGGTRTGTVACT